MRTKLMWSVFFLLSTALPFVRTPSLAIAQVRTLTVAYMPSPLLNHQVNAMVDWGKSRGIEIVPASISYEVYVEKMSTVLSAGSREYDIIWQNDDWGQLWGRFLEPVEDVSSMKGVKRDILVDKPVLWEGKATAVPIIDNLSPFFYRTDLVPANRTPKTWDEMIEVSRELQRQGKVKWGYVGGMKYPHGFWTYLVGLWSNGCDLFSPVGERDNAKLAANGWKSMLDQPCAVWVVNYWRDAIYKHKTSPPGMVGYTRTDADAIFMAGDALFSMQDPTVWGDYNNPAKSRVAGKVGVMRWPKGPHAKGTSTWRAAWFWAIPKSIAPERKVVAKELINYVTSDRHVQREIWTKLGGIPGQLHIQQELAREDPKFAELKAVGDVDELIAPCYYHLAWSELFAILSDSMTKAVIGREEDTLAVLREGARKLTERMTSR